MTALARFINEPKNSLVPADGSLILSKEEVSVLEKFEIHFKEYYRALMRARMSGAGDRKNIDPKVQSLGNEAVNILREYFTKKLGYELKSYYGNLDLFLEHKIKIASLLYKKLNPMILKERDDRDMPMLFPIHIDTNEYTLVFECKDRTSSGRALYLMSSRINNVYGSDFLMGCFGDLSSILAINHKSSYAELKASYKGLIPAEHYEAIERACLLAGRENVYMIVDCTGIEFSNVKSVPEGDPVVVAVLGTNIFHITDFDTTPIEEALAFSASTLKVQDQT